MKKVSKLQTSWEQRLGEKRCFVKMLAAASILATLFVRLRRFYSEFA